MLFPIIQTWADELEPIRARTTASHPRWVW